MIDPEQGFTSSVIVDPERFVGRSDLIRDCVKALNAKTGLITIYGKRGVGKSSMLRRLQQISLGDYALIKQAQLLHLLPERPRKYLTVYYQCDAKVKDIEDLLKRLCTDQDPEDGLLRLVPDDGKVIEEFTRSKEVSVGADLKVVNWGTKGLETTKYAKVVENDIVQTFRNFVNAIVTHQVKGRMKRDGLLILLDEFDVIRDKSAVGSIIKSLSSDHVKFAICGIADDLTELVRDHASVERLVEEGALHVRPMSAEESKDIIHTAERLFEGGLTFDHSVTDKIADISQGYPYFVQQLGKACVAQANEAGTTKVTDEVFAHVMDDIKSGKAFPNLERQYQLAIGNNHEGRKMLLHLLAGQSGDASHYNEEVGLVVLKEARKDAEDLDIKYIDQLIPRLVEKKSGPVLRRSGERQGIYEFVNPVLRLYIRLRATP
jgi:Cdc6-like AAA superfamily ATPase